MPQERGYIPENQQVHTQTEMPEQKLSQERTNSRLRRIRQIGPLLVVMLAANLGVVGAARTPRSQEPDVQPQTIVNLLENSSYEDSANPPTNSTPKFWNAPPHSVNVPDPSFDYQNGFYQDGASSVDTDGYITDTSCNTDTNGWEQSFPVNSSNTYTLSFANYTPPGSSPDLNPRATITWKNGTTIIGTDDHAFNRILGPDYWESGFARTYGSGGVAIPSGSTSATLQVSVGSTKTSSCTPGTEGKQYFDMVTVMGPAPTPPSVGGIAEIPNLPPGTTVSHSTRNTIVEIAVAGGAALAGSIAVAEAFRRRKRQG